MLPSGERIFLYYYITFFYYFYEIGDNSLFIPLLKKDINEFVFLNLPYPLFTKEGNLIFSPPLLKWDTEGFF